MRNLKTKITKRNVILAAIILIAALLASFGIYKIVQINTELNNTRSMVETQNKQLKELDSKYKTTEEEKAKALVEKREAEEKSLQLQQQNTNLETEKKDLKAQLLTKQENAKRFVAAKSSVPSAKSPGYTGATAAGNSYVAGTCTWYVKNMRPDIGNRWGNANQWISSASAAGYNVSSTPSVGSIAVQGNHVAYVTAVSGGTVTISEMNYGGLWRMNTRTVAVGLFTYIS